jgi:hypothetical protein
MNHEEGCNKLLEIVDFYQKKRNELYELYNKALEELEKRKKFDMDRVTMHTPSIAAFKDWSEYDEEYIHKLCMRPDDEK